MVSNNQEFLHVSRRMLVKKFAKDGKLILATWNARTLLEKIELVDTMIRRRINIACLQETNEYGKNIEK